jgi:MFS family permease
MGDKYGRRPVYGSGLLINGSIIIILVFQKNVIVAYMCLFMLGVSITARYYVGYTYNLEFQRKKN